MLNNKVIDEIFKLKERELKTWLWWGFIGKHHWKDKNYIQMIMFPLLIIIFVFSSCMFSYEIFENFQNFNQSGKFDLNNALMNNKDIIPEELIYEFIPINWLILMGVSIISSLIWWIYDLRNIEKKYLKQISGISGKKTQGKKLHITYSLLVLFGMLGLHRFYLGKYETGVAMLILSLIPVVSIIVLFWFLYDLFTIYKVILKENKKLYKT